MTPIVLSANISLLAAETAFLAASKIAENSTDIEAFFDAIAASKKFLSLLEYHNHSQ